MKSLSSTTIIKTQNLGKKYFLSSRKPSLINSLFSSKTTVFWALKNINLHIRQGEKIGLLGPNGSGKSTLLKILAGVTQSTQGSIKTSGKIASIIDLKAGFNDDLNAYENILLNGLLLGMTHQQIKQKTQEIIHFSEIGQFAHHPLHTYSNGMVLRLGFSIILHLDPDILLVDEIIEVGDQKFINRCREKIQIFCQKEKTLIIASHNLENLKRLTQKIIWLEKGRIKTIGPTKQIIKKYLQNAPGKNRLR